MYKVVRDFVDLLDDFHSYTAGDVYPRDGLRPPDERFAELSGSDNLQGVPLIRKTAERRKKEG